MTMNNNILKLAVVSILLTLPLLPGQASAQADVTAMGLGGAWTSMSRGMDSVDWNPANLAISKPNTVFFGANLVAGFQNNAFSIDHYNQYTGALITQDDKDFLLGEIPDEGLVLDTYTHFSAFGLAIGPFALTVQGMGGAQGTIDKDLFDLAFNGNILDREYNLDNTAASGYALAATTLTYALPIYTTFGYQLSGGLNYRFLKGFYDFTVEDVSGGMVTRIEGFELDAEATAVTAEGGGGHAIDFGLALQAPRGWTFGFALSNLSSNITWDDNPERHSFYIYGDSLSAETEDFDERVTDADTTVSIGSYETSLPRILRLGASNTWRDFHYAVDLVKGFDNRPGVSDNTALNLGTEWQVTGWFRPRLGLGFGGLYGRHASIGMGINAGPMHLNWALANRGRIFPGDAKGLAVGFGLSVRI
jgi:Family of unknown function (DUF5723)